MLVYVVFGGCWGDEHIIAIYRNEKKAQKRADKENAECSGLDAYVQIWELEK